MTSPFATGAGAVAVVLGVAWVVFPTRMKRMQMKYLYFGMSDASPDQTDAERLVSRVTGVVLAALGVVLLAGLLP